jgi:ParB family chromosome partitioning protein
MVTLTQNVIREIAIQDIERNPHQPRRVFSEATILELSESIRSEGLLQPILVRKKDRGYELIAGERRLRACAHLGFVNVPARVIEASDASSAVISLIENLQRENLNPIDEALGLMSLMQDFGLTQEAVAGRVGKNRATVANALRLLQLDKEVQGYLSRGLLSTGHAKVILGLEDKAQQTVLARKILESGMSVREAEKAVKNLRQQAMPGAKPASHLSLANKAQTEKVVLERIQKKLSQHLSAAVNILHGPKRGKLVIEYRGNDDLDRILGVLGLPPA